MEKEKISVSLSVIVLSGAMLVSDPGAHQASTLCPFMGEEISRLRSPIKTGAPEAIFARVADAGTTRTKMARIRMRICERFMKSNFKTLMIKIMTFI
ncbi:MAG: hypothetical protein STSR0009_23090 [Methanoregula sp.]